MSRPKRRINPDAKPGPVPIYKDRARIYFSIEREILCRAQTCADIAEMPVNQWITGLIVAEFQRQDLKKERAVAKKV
jgi:hypothetical protein